MSNSVVLTVQKIDGRRLEGSAAPAIRTGAQWPMADPIIVSLVEEELSRV